MMWSGLFTGNWGGGGSGLVIVNARSTELAKAVVVSLAEIIRQS